jgi:cardiolipin synthase (CMP-forming)
MARTEGATTTHWWTIPNLLSLLRIACIPLFCWLALGPEAYAWAFVVLVVAGVSDFLDGALARRWNQESELGRLLDPFADRLTSVVVPITLAIQSIVPWWFVVVLLARDAVLAIATAVLLGRRRMTLQVSFLGKAATFCLLAGFPILLLGTFEGAFGTAALMVGWAMTLWGTFLYWWSALVYLGEIRRLSGQQAAA